MKFALEKYRCPDVKGATTKSCKHTIKLTVIFLSDLRRYE